MKKLCNFSALILIICLLSGLIQVPVCAADENRNMAGVWLNNNPWHERNGIAAEFEEGSGSYEILSDLGCKLGLNGDGGNIGFKINADIAFPEKSTWKFKNAKRWCTFYADICYWDEGMGGFYFQYDSYNGIKNVFIQCENSKTWKYARIKLYDARFNGNDNGYDCRIVTHDKDLFPYAEGHASPVPVYIYWLKLYSDNCYSGFNVTAETGKPGNVFYEGDEIKFDFAFNNFDLVQYDNMRVKYSVYKPEAKDEYLQWEETIDKSNKGQEAVAYSEQTPIREKNQTAVFSARNAYDTVTFENLKFGTYVLKTDITADYSGTADKMQMSILTDFSYSKKAEPNPHYGANAHYDDYYYENNVLYFLYNEQDIDNQISLAKNAGFGKMRSTLRWIDVQARAGGPYSMPDILVYAYKALSENGMSGLCNLMAENRNGYGDYWDGSDILGDTPEELESFAEYSAFVASKLKPYTKYYAILNEFDLKIKPGVTGLSGDGYDMPSDKAYADIVKASSDAIKAVQPEAWIDAGQIAEDPAWQFDARWFGKYTWDTRFLKQVDTSKFDSVSYHRYDSLMSYGPEGTDLLGFTTFGKSQLEKYAPNAKLWVTEVGWPARDRALNYNGASAFRNTNYETQAAFMARLLAMYASNDPVDMLMFYEFQDDREDPFSFEENFGIIHSMFYRTPWAAKPSYVAVAAFNSLTGKTVKSESLAVTPAYGQSYNSYSPVVYKLTNDEGQETFCVWSTGAEKNYTVNTGKDYTVVYDLFGNVIDTVDGAEVTVTASTDMKYVIGYDYAKTELYAEINNNRISDISAVKNGDEMVIHYTQATAETPDSLLICAAYADDRLVEVLNINTEEYIGKEKTMSVLLADTSKFNKIKVFAWDNSFRAKQSSLLLEK
ncbi:MAG: hypothetical protein J6N52_09905 [Clostridia bacterium]|nr:hypothetical protein [Clostridia bacterium]